MKTRLVIVNIEKKRGLLSHPERFCSAQRLSVLSRISDNEKRMQSAAAELALSIAMSSDELAPPVYGRLKNGKPVTERGFISLSHTDGFAAAAYSDVPCGVDIEAKRPVSPALLRRVLCPAELILLSGADESFALSRFVVKEAFLKLTGAGVFGGARDVYETEGRVFFRGVLSGFVQCFDSDEYICRLVTEQASPTEPVVY